jgi:hypothetical protein
MLVKHYLTITAKCPINPGTMDRYDAIIECSLMLSVERILEEIEKFRELEIYQERLTESLAETLGAKVTTTGFHSGVKTVCEA